MAAIALLRLALAGPCQGTDALAGGQRPEGLGDKLLRRLTRAAAGWTRWAPEGSLTPTQWLLDRADSQPWPTLPGLARAFIHTAHTHTRQARRQDPARRAAARRKAERRRQQILGAWPAWIARHDDQLVLDPGHRFIQIHRLPDRTELDDPQLRRWLRAITTLTWGSPALAVELTDPAGRYALIPLTATHEGRTRNAWISTVPRRTNAALRARRGGPK